MPSRSRAAPAPVRSLSGNVIQRLQTNADARVDAPVVLLRSARRETLPSGTFAGSTFVPMRRNACPSPRPRDAVGEDILGKLCARARKMPYAHPAYAGNVPGMIQPHRPERGSAPAGGCPAVIEGRQARSDRTAVLSGTEYPQYPHIVGCRAASGVGDCPVERPISARAGQFPHAREFADRPKARLLEEPPYLRAAGRQPAPGARSRSRLGQPPPRGIKIGQHLGRIDQRARHGGNQV